MAVYVASFDNFAVSTTRDLFSGSFLVHTRIRRVRLSTSATAYQKLRLTIKKRGASWAQGTGGTSLGGFLLSKTFVASNASVLGSTTLSSGDTPVILHADLWDISKPFEWAPLGRRGFLDANKDVGFDPDYAAVTVSLEVAPAASVNVSGCLEWEELTAPSV